MEEASSSSTSQEARLPDPMEIGAQYCTQGVSPMRIDDEETPSSKEIDAALSRSLFNMPVEDREKALRDVHSVPEVRAEDPEQMDQKLQVLQERISRIQEGSAYEEAEVMNTEYCTNRKFRLMFLRAERYDPQEAAALMLRFFEMKKALFGAAKLTRDIGLQDLNEEDLTNLKTGGYQISELKDMAGRSIFLQMAKLRVINGIEDNVLRAEYYVLMKEIMKGDEVQRRGMTSIFWLVDTKKFIALSDPNTLRNAVPIHRGALHCCFDDPDMYRIGCKTLSSMPPNVQARFRATHGSTHECLAALKGFGIPPEAIPVSEDGAIDMSSHYRWLAACESQDSPNEPLFGSLPSPESATANSIAFAPSSRQYSFETGAAVTTECDSDEMPWDDGYGLPLSSKSEKEFGASSTTVSSSTVSSQRGSSGRLSVIGSDQSTVPSSAVSTQTSSSSSETTDQDDDSNSNNERPRPWPNSRRRRTAPPVLSDSLLGSAVFSSGDGDAKATPARVSSTASLEEGDGSGGLRANPGDVLFGRGRYLSDHEGNIQFRNMVDFYMPQYEFANKHDKTVIANWIVEYVKQQGRFLKKDEASQQWEEVDLLTARKKVAHAFRNRRKLHGYY